MLKTCPKHEVIFRRKCGHADTTLKYPPITRIKCRECVGRSIFSKARQNNDDLKQAKHHVKHFTKELNEVHRQGKSGKDTKLSLDEWTKRGDELEQVYQDIIGKTDRFGHFYGDFDWYEWQHKVDDKVAVDAKVYKQKDRVVYFKRRPDDIHSEKEVNMKLADIVESFNNPHHPHGKMAQIMEVSKEQRASLSSLYELYLERMGQ